MLTADPVRRPNMLRLSVLESSRMPYIFFASRYPISKPGKGSTGHQLHSAHRETIANQAEVAEVAEKVRWIEFAESLRLARWLGWGESEFS